MLGADQIQTGLWQFLSTLGAKSDFFDLSDFHDFPFVNTQLNFAEIEIANDGFNRLDPFTRVCFAIGRRSGIGVVERFVHRFLVVRAGGLSIKRVCRFSLFLI